MQRVCCCDGASITIVFSEVKGKSLLCLLGCEARIRLSLRGAPWRGKRKKPRESVLQGRKWLKDTLVCRV